MISINGILATSGVIRIPKHGAWSASISIGEDVVIGGSALISDGESTIVGRIIAGGQTDSVNAYRIAGSSVELEDAVMGVEYRTPTVRMILTHLLGTSWVSPLATVTLSAWTVRRGRRDVALGELCEQIGAHWYAMPDGRVSVVPSVYAVSTSKPLVIAEDLSYGEVQYETEGVLSVLPGYTYEGRSIGSVVYKIAGDGLQCTALIARPVDPVRAKIELIAQSAVSRASRYAHAVGGTVVSATESIVSVLLDTGESIDSAPSTYGLPGTRGIPSGGSRAWIAWDQADPSKPRIVAFEGDAKSIRLASGTQGSARVGDTVDCGVLSVSSTGTVTGYLPGTANAVSKAAAKAAAIAAGGLSFALIGQIKTGSSIVKVG